jgi:imidazolonepropionase-like amidohydrolase
MLLLTNAFLHPVSHSAIQRGYLWIDPPVIRAIGSGDPPADLLAVHQGPVVDLAGSHIVPGLIDAHCHIGLFNDGLASEGYDANEHSDPVTPHMQAIDGLFQDDRCFAEALAAGVTTVMTGPGSANVLGGSFAVLHTAGNSFDTMLVRQTAAMKAALGENPKKSYGKRERAPATRMANAAILREALTKAQHYREQLEQKNKDGDAQQTRIEPDARWDALLPVLSGDLPLKIHVHRSDDIQTAIRIAESFGLRYTLDHCTEGYLIVDQLVSAYQSGRQTGHGCGQAGKGRLEGIITGPLLSDRSKPELARSDIRNPGVLTAAGLPVAIMTDHPVIPEQYLSLSAAATVRAGLSEEEALAAITLKAARICGLADERGCLEVDKRADLAVFSAHPFDYRSQTRFVMIDGRQVWTAQDEKQRAEPL